MSSSSLPERADFARLLPRARGAIIAPSFLSADFGVIAEEVARAEAAGADVLHLDVMDGHFVPNLTFGPPVVKAVRRRTSLPFDVHLMIRNPADFVGPFADAGADHLTFHVEVTPDRREVERVIGLMRARSLGVGISLRPATPVESVVPHLDLVDLLLVMSVDPGFGGQPFIPESLPRLRDFRAHRDAARHRYVIEVDGGINQQTAESAVAAGAEMLVAGTALYGPGDMRARVGNMREAAARGAASAARAR